MIVRVNEARDEELAGAKPVDCHWSARRRHAQRGECGVDAVGLHILDDGRDLAVGVVIDDDERRWQDLQLRQRSGVNQSAIKCRHRHSYFLIFRFYFLLQPRKLIFFLVFFLNRRGSIKVRAAHGMMVTQSGEITRVMRSTQIMQVIA